MGYDLQQRLDAFVSGGGSPGALIQELRLLCDATPDSSWDVLALIDQYYRRGKLSRDLFQAIRYRIERHALGVRDSDTIPELPDAPLVSEAAPAAMRGTGLVRGTELEARSALANTQRVLDVRRSKAAGHRERLRFNMWRDRMRAWRPGRSSQAIVLVSILLFVGASPALQDLPIRRQVTHTALPTAAAVIPPISRPGQISLSADRFLVFPGHASADIQIQRTDGDGGDVSFVWWTQASGAKPGRDYVSRTPSIVLVPDGVDTVHLSVQILANPSRKHTELFYVVIGKPGGGASLGSVRRATVFIMRPG